MGVVNASYILAMRSPEGEAPCKDGLDEAFAWIGDREISLDQAFEEAEEVGLDVEWAAVSLRIFGYGTGDGAYGGKGGYGNGDGGYGSNGHGYEAGDGYGAGYGYGDSSGNGYGSDYSDGSGHGYGEGYGYSNVYSNGYGSGDY